jgi:hypothetical protein
MREERKRAGSSMAAEKVNATKARIPGMLVRLRNCASRRATPTRRLSIVLNSPSSIARLEHTVCKDRVQPSRKRQDPYGDISGGCDESGWIVTFAGINDVATYDCIGVDHCR